MPIKASEINVFLVDKTQNCNPKKLMPKFNRGFNEAIDQQGQKELTLNREKLANLIYQEMGGQSSELNRAGCLALADAIIAKEHELFEVKK